MHFVFTEKITKVFKLAKLLLLFVLFFVSPLAVDAASMSVTPTTGSFEVGNKVNLKVIVTSDTPFNAVSGVISYPSIFSVESVSKTGSVLDF